MTCDKTIDATLSHCLIAATKSMIKFVWEADGWEGLTGPQFGILAHLHKAGTLHPSELSDRLGVTAGNITGMITRLKKLGYVERRRLTSDRRCLRIGLTAEGRKLFEKVMPLWHKRVEECFRPFPAQEKQQLISLLDRLCRSLPGTPILPI